MLRRITGAKTVQCLLVVAALGVSLGQLHADDSASATVIALFGQVSWLKDGQPWVLNLNDKVAPGRTIVTGPDGYAQFRVSDGSTFEVFPNSRTVFRQNPANWSNLLDLFIGRVKVHIQKFANRPNNNRVRTPTAVISVRGTIFDVVVENEDVTYVSVDEGLVSVENIAAPGGGERLLHPGEELRVFKDQPLARRVDKGTAAQVVLRSARDALMEAIYRTPRTAGAATATGGTPLPGDHKKPGDTAPPPPPPPPPPPSPFLPVGTVVPGAPAAGLTPDMMVGIALRAAAVIH